MTTYHPDEAIAAEVAADVLSAEMDDLAAGFPARRWLCECGTSHARGFFLSPGVHRCLRCGYVGTGGLMLARGEA